MCLCRSPEQILIDCRERGWKQKTFTPHVSDRLAQTTAHTGKSQRLKQCINIIGNKKQGRETAEQHYRHPVFLITALIRAS